MARIQDRVKKDVERYTGIGVARVQVKVSRVECWARGSSRWRALGLGDAPMKRLFEPIVQRLRGRNAGFVGLVLGFILGLLLVLFGVLRTLLIIALSCGGYYVGIRYFADAESFRRLLDRLLPPGRFR